VSQTDDSAPFVATLGETMVALVAEEMAPLRYVSRFQRRIAGAESNVALGLVRLGIRAGWISRLGNDEFGRHVYATLRGEGVDVSQVQWDDLHPTGVMFKELRALGKSRVSYYRAGSAASHLSSEMLSVSYLRQVSHLHFTGITPALSRACTDAALKAICTVAEAGGTVSFDVNLRDQLGVEDPLEAFSPFVRASEILFLGLDEAETIFRTRNVEEIEHRLETLEIPTVVLKLGAGGAKAYVTDRDRWLKASGYEVNVVDEVGAGDAFAAAYIASVLRGFPVKKSLRMANAAGALAITVPGDVEGLAGWEELEEISRDPDGKVRR
jgi:2-dehydro-3-deoxygluconokinase